jgi:septin family protein
MKKLKNWTMLPKAAIMGTKGAGKTTLFNELCETKHIADESTGSLTKMVENMHFIL